MRPAWASCWGTVDSVAVAVAIDHVQLPIVGLGVVAAVHAGGEGAGRNLKCFVAKQDERQGRQADAKADSRIGDGFDNAIFDHVRLHAKKAPQRKPRGLGLV